MLNKFCLGHKQARKLHHKIINASNSYALTVTLHPDYNIEPINIQFNLLDNELRCLFKRLNRTYNWLMYTPELTERANLHYHVYFIMPEGMHYDTFEQQFKSLRRKSSVIGTNYKLTKIDDPEGDIKEYPFKDIDRTNRVSRIENLFFLPYHGIYKGQSPFKSDSK